MLARPLLSIKEILLLPLGRGGKEGDYKGGQKKVTEEEGGGREGGKHSGTPRGNQSSPRHTFIDIWKSSLHNLSVPIMPTIVKPLCMKGVNTEEIPRSILELVLPLSLPNAQPSPPFLIRPIRSHSRSKARESTCENRAETGGISNGGSHATFESHFLVVYL